MNTILKKQKSKVQSFMDGFNSIFNIKGDFFELPEIKNDNENILSDWQAVGNDIRNVAMGKEISKGDSPKNSRKNKKKYE